MEKKLIKKVGLENSLNTISSGKKKAFRLM